MNPCIPPSGALFAAVGPLAPCIRSTAPFNPSHPSISQAPGGGYLPVSVQPEQPGGPRASWEGGPQRCFRSMYVCTNGVNTTETWPLHAFGRNLVRHHLDSLPAEAQPVVRAQPPMALQRRLRLAAEAKAGGSGSSNGGSGGGMGINCPRRSGGAAGMQDCGGPGGCGPDSGSGSSSGSGGSAAEPAVLNILFHRRGTDRLLLNAAELLERCNAWSYTTAAGVQVRARCSEVGGG